MNWARQRHVPSADYDAETIARRRGGGMSTAVVIALFASIMSAGLGYYALQLASEQRVARDQLASSAAERRDLTGRNAKLTQEAAAAAKERDERDRLLAEANAKLLELNTELAATQTRLDELEQERSEFKEQLAEFKQMTRQFKRMIDSGRLEVTFRRGRMIVELPAQVLFPSGSADLTDDGRKALSEVAKILRGLRSRHFVVAGHTDNVPVANERFASNWELSSARAVNVTAALIRGGMRPEQLVAAGYAEYDPVASNAREVGRQKNRRIEIILEPRLKPVPGLSGDTDPKAKAKDKPAAKATKAAKG